MPKSRFTCWQHECRITFINLIMYFSCSGLCHLDPQILPACDSQQLLNRSPMSHVISSAKGVCHTFVWQGPALGPVSVAGVDPGPATDNKDDNPSPDVRSAYGTSKSQCATRAHQARWVSHTVVVLPAESKMPSQLMSLWQAQARLSL